MTKHLRRPDSLPLSRMSIPPPIKNVIFTASVSILGVLSACSPYAYSDHTQKLSTAMAAIDTAYQQNAQQIIADRKLQSRLSWVAEKSPLVLTPGCVDTTGTARTGPCEVVPEGEKVSVIDPPSKSAPAASTGDVCEVVARPASTPAPEAAKVAAPLTSAALVKALDDYAAALAALTKAQDRADFDSAADKLSAAVGGLAGPTAGPLAKASSSMLLWLVGQDLDYRRLRELRIATAAACEPIHTLEGPLERALVTQRHARLLVLGNILVLDMQAVKHARANPRVTDYEYDAAIEKAQAAADAFEAERATDPQATAQALSKVHDELVVAVRSNNGQFKELITALEDFTAKAKDLAATAAAKPTSAKSAKAS